MKYKPPLCEKCNARNPVKHQRVVGANWALDFKLLCNKCGRKLRYVPVNHDRPYVGMQSQRLM